jgi:UDP-glucose 4-epimerase
MRVLVTGGNGFIGGRLCRFLGNDPEFEIFSASRSPVNQAKTGEPVIAVTSDWNSLESLAACCAGMDAVVHLAAMNAADSTRDPVAALAINGVGTARLVQAAIDCGVRRFVYVSTAHVYGAPLTGTITEDTCPCPLHPYATSHRAAEDVVRAASARGAIDGVVLRLSNGFGAPASARADCWSLLFNDLCRQVVVSGAMILRSSGTQRRDFVSMANICRAIRHVLYLPAASSRDRVFNLGGQWSPTVFEAATLVAERFAKRGHPRPGISRSPAVPGEEPKPLDYRIEVLMSTGFVPETDSAAELDGLIAFCEAAFGA